MTTTLPSQRESVQCLANTRTVAAVSSESKAHLGHLLSTRPTPSQTSLAQTSLAQAAWQVTPAGAGDHPLIHHFLQGVSRQPSVTEFQAQLEDPAYEPCDRLIIKHQEAIIAHLRLNHREMRFGPALVPVSVICDFVVAPAYRDHGCTAAMLIAARQGMIQNGSVLGMLQTDTPDPFRRQNWSVCGRHHRSAAGPREILSHLRARQEQESNLAQSVFESPRSCKYNIRLWRHVEMAALLRLYSEKAERLHGPIERSDSYWRWLVSRGGNDCIYIAINGRDEFELDASLSPIVGYAVTKEGRIVEIMCAAEHPEASTQLLARACGDAIERGIERVDVDAPAEDPLHALLVAAGGDRICYEADNGMVHMVDVLKPQRLVRLLSKSFCERAKKAGLAMPCELGLLVDGKKSRFSVRHRSVQWRSGKLGRSYLQCSSHDLAPLLLGHLDVRQSVETGRLKASTRVALDIAEALFPAQSLWHPPWDDLPA